MKVFVTDADQKHALAAVRALGREKVIVHVGATSSSALAFFSRHCSRKLVYPDPGIREKEFVECLITYAQREGIDVLLPISYSANVIVSKYKGTISKYMKVAISDYEQMLTAANKAKSMAFAESVGIKVPKVYHHLEEIERYPVVVKGIKGSGNVTYVNSPEGLAGLDLEEMVIQEYIPGQGYGFYGLFHHGEPRAIFMHRRRREFPVTGGASTAAESYYDERLKEQGVHLLSALQWHGVAMVEMKLDQRNGDYKLMEINPKFWGSLDLSIQAGVNFPYLAAMMALNGDVELVMEYDRDAKFSWPFPQDLLHILARPKSAGQFLADMFDPKMKTNLCFEDFLPNLYLIGMTPLVIANRLLKRRLYFTHGKPEFLHDQFGSSRP
jgi:predicted ATP-grasp superfamily ATP-dependent carboligase